MFLLDVNMLVALAWDDHTQHDQAHEWFSGQAQSGFATCHVTQSGFVRVSLQISGVSCQITTQDAIGMLNSFTSQQSHSFWNDGPVETSSALWPTVTGHKHVTDLNLFLIARRNGGRLVTFDASIKSRLPDAERQWVEVVDA